MCTVIWICICTYFDIEDKLFLVSFWICLEKLLLLLCCYGNCIHVYRHVYNCLKHYKLSRAKANSLLPSELLRAFLFYYFIYYYQTHVGIYLICACIKELFFSDVHHHLIDFILRTTVELRADEIFPLKSDIFLGLVRNWELTTY